MSTSNTKYISSTCPLSCCNGFTKAQAFLRKHSRGLREGWVRLGSVVGWFPVNPLEPVSYSADLASQGNSQYLNFQFSWDIHVGDYRFRFKTSCSIQRPLFFHWFCLNQTKPYRFYIFICRYLFIGWSESVHKELNKNHLMARWTSWNATKLASYDFLHHSFWN